MRMLNIWVATPTQQSGWGRAYHKGKSGPAMRRAAGSAPAFAGPAGPSMPPLIFIVHECAAPSPTPCDQGQRGCCPYIVRPGPKGSVIQAFTGYRGNAAIIVDWGSPWNQNCDWRRNCTVSDIGFM